jgi:hemerythrin superfamily protein
MIILPSKEGENPMDAIALLKADHREVEQLFKQFEKAGDRALKQKEKLVEKMIRALAVHAAIEEMFFYPTVRTAALKKDNKLGEDASDLVLESLEEHHIVKWTLSELEKMNASDERFEAKVTVLIESVKHHVEEEEEDLFPKVKRLLNAKLLNELGERMEKAKKLVPTRPHPRASDTPPGNFVAGTVAMMMDKGKDLVKGMLKQ